MRLHDLIESNNSNIFIGREVLRVVVVVDGWSTETGDETRRAEPRWHGMGWDGIIKSSIRALDSISTLARSHCVEITAPRAEPNGHILSIESANQQLLY